MTIITLKVNLDVFANLYLINRTLLENANSNLETFILNENYEVASQMHEVIKNLVDTNILLKTIIDKRNKEIRKQKIRKIFNT